MLQGWEGRARAPCTPSTITRKDAFLREIAQIRQQGYAMDNEENGLGVRCAAAAIPDWHGAASYALSISAPVSRMTDERVRSLIPALLETRNEISACPGGRLE